MNDDMQSPIVRFGIGFGALFAVFGSVISGYFITQIFLEARASGDWPSVEGQLTKVAVGETGTGSFFADVSYRYAVDGRDYVGTRVRASDGEYNIRDGAVQAIDGLKEGQRVAVHYNPLDPGKSVLHAGAGFAAYALLVVPVVMLVLGVLVFRRLWRTRCSRST